MARRSGRWSLKRARGSSSRATTIFTDSADSKIKTIGIGGTRTATTASSPALIRLTARVTYRPRFRAFTTWTITANGSIRPNTAGCGVRAESPQTGPLIATVIGDGFPRTAGRGFRTSRGAGRLITTVGGLTFASAGVGRRSSMSSMSVRVSPGAGNRITWSSSDGEAVTTAAIATGITMVTGRDSATGATDIWAGARSGRAIGITGRGTTRLASKRSGTFTRQGR